MCRSETGKVIAIGAEGANLFFISIVFWFYNADSNRYTALLPAAKGQLRFLTCL